MKDVIHTIKLAAIAFAGVGLAVMYAGGQPAQAQNSDSATANAVGSILESLVITGVTDLDFGVMIASTSVTGTVKVIPINGEQTGDLEVTGVTHLGGNHQANFQISGTPGRVVSNTLQPGAITITSGPSNKMTVDAFSRDGAPNFPIPFNGSFGFAIGATLHVGKNQPTGAYSGTFLITAEYQ